MINRDLATSLIPCPNEQPGLVLRWLRVFREAVCSVDLLPWNSSAESWRCGENAQVRQLRDAFRRLGDKSCRAGIAMPMCKRLQVCSPGHKS